MRILLVVWALLSAAAVASAEPINPYELEKPSGVEYINPYFPTLCEFDGMVKHCKQQDREFTIYPEIFQDLELVEESSPFIVMDDEFRLLVEHEIQDVPEPKALAALGLLLVLVFRR